MIHRTALVRIFGIGLTLAGCGGGSKPADIAASPQAAAPATPSPAAADCTREIPVPPVPAALRQMKWKDGAGHGTGTDPQALFTFAPTARMCGIRLRFTLETRNKKPAFFQVFWAKAGAEFSEAAGSWGTTVESSPQEQTVVVRGCSPSSTRCAERDIALIRIDPATAPVAFKLAELTVLAQQ